MLTIPDSCSLLQCSWYISYPFDKFLIFQGHQLVASIAQRLLTDKTLTALSKIVEPTPLDLSILAPWADRIKHTHAYWWSGTLHYINPIQDFPPGTCSADFSDVRTPDRTLLTAIANYTDRLSNENLDRWGREEALRFLVHFMGDAEQPLHRITLFNTFANCSDGSSERRQ